MGNMKKPNIFKYSQPRVLSVKVETARCLFEFIKKSSASICRCTITFYDQNILEEELFISEKEINHLVYDESDNCTPNGLHFKTKVQLKVTQLRINKLSPVVHTS